MQLHGQRQHGGGALRFGGGGRGGAGDLLQAAGLRGGFHLGHLLAQLRLTILRFLQLARQLVNLLGLLGGGTGLLLGSSQLTGEILDTGAELITLTLHGNQLRGNILVAGSLRGLSGQLIDLSAQTIHLSLELLVLGGERTVALLGLGQLRGVNLRRLGTGVRRGGLQALVLLLQRLHLRGQLGDLGVQAGNIRTERLRGLAALHGLTAQRFNGFGDLIQEVVDLVDIIAFLQANGSERMLPNVLRRQQSHKSCTSLQA